MNLTMNTTTQNTNPSAQARAIHNNDATTLLRGLVEFLTEAQEDGAFDWMTHEAESPATRQRWHAMWRCLQESRSLLEEN
jgi:hypothetical protein